MLSDFLVLHCPWGSDPRRYVLASFLVLSSGKMPVWMGCALYLLWFGSILYCFSQENQLFNLKPDLPVPKSCGCSISM